MDWAGLDNGELLARAEKEFDVFITVDRNLTFQQNLPKFDISLLFLRTRINRLKDLISLVPKIIDALNNPQRDKAVFIDSQRVCRKSPNP